MRSKQEHCTAAALLPSIPDGLTVKTRHLKGQKGWVPMTCAGFFKQGSKRMTMAELGKAAALTIDVDPYDWQGAAERWGDTRKVRKAAMRAASVDDLDDWLTATDLLGMVVAEAAAAGLPAQPNRVVMTGQGYCLIYWLPADLGWVGGSWAPDQMKSALKRWMKSAAAPWWWDDSAKDVGTRIFPLPGVGHRDTGKPVRLLHQHDHIDAARMLSFFEQIDAAHPADLPRKAKKRSLPRKARQPQQQQQKRWVYRQWMPSYPVLPVGERSPCPLCAGSGYKRMDAEHYSCFSCCTRFTIAPDPDDVWPDATVLPLDALGRAQWPAAPPRLVNRARTGAGKTWLMQQLVKQWHAPGLHQRRVLAISPTIALAQQLADRLDLAHADSTSGLHLGKQSLACCFASIRKKAAGLQPIQLSTTYVMVDEIESCLQQLLGMLAGDAARETYNLLIFCLAHAGSVMLADAHAGPCTKRLLADVAAYRLRSGALPGAWDVWKTSPHCHQLEYVPALTRTTAKGKTVTVSSSDAEHKGLLLKQLSDGEKLAVYIPGREAALGFADVVRRRWPDRRVVAVVGSKSHETRADLSQSALTADVLVYNNAMATGVSFDLPEHYDRVHVLLGRGAVTTALHVEQAAHRIRKPRHQVITISGYLSEPVTDWRADVAGQVKEAEDRLAAGDYALTSIRKGLTLASDWMMSDDSQRLGWMQATVLASAYQHGLRWVVPWLGSRHQLTDCPGSINPDFTRAISDAKAARDAAEALAIAAAPPLSDMDVERVEAHGADTDDEYHQWKAAVFEGIYGAGYTTSTTADRADIAHRTKRQQWAARTRVFAAALCIAAGEEDKLAVAEVKASKRKTFMTAAPAIPRARCLAVLMQALAQMPVQAGRRYISTAQCRTLLRIAAPWMKVGGIKRRADARSKPFAQLQQLLRFGGVKLQSIRPAGSNRERIYFLDDATMDAQTRLAWAMMQRWLAEEEEETSSAMVFKVA